MFLTEERINELKDKGIRFPIVDDNCIGCGACISVCPEVFELNEEKSDVIEMDNYDDKGVDEAIQVCPVEAIRWE